MKSSTVGYAITLSVMPTMVCAAETASISPGFNAVAGGGGLTQMVFGLLVILALIAGVAWLMRRYMPLRGGEGAIKVVGGLALGSRERMVLVEVGGVRVLVGVAPGRLQTLHVFNTSEADPPNAAMSESREAHHE